MKQQLFFKVLIVGVLVVIFGVGMYFLGNKHGVESMSIRRVTPTQLANAMKDDHFWSSYRENTLLLTGSVSSVSQTSSDTTLGLRTTSSYKTYCDLGVSHTHYQLNQRVTVLAEAGPAKRLPAGVLLTGCVTL